jgi:hypothetical protein
LSQHILKLLLKEWLLDTRRDDLLTTVQSKLGDEIIKLLQANSVTGALKDFPWESSLVKANPFYPQFMQAAPPQGDTTGTEARLKELKEYLARAQTRTARTGTLRIGTPQLEEPNAYPARKGAKNMDKGTIDSLCDPSKQWLLTSKRNDGTPPDSATIKIRVFDYSKDVRETYDFQFAHGDGTLYGTPDGIRTVFEESVRSFRRFRNMKTLLTLRLAMKRIANKANFRTVYALH